MWIRLNQHPSFTANFDAAGVSLMHWHDETIKPFCDSAGFYRCGPSLDILELAAAIHLRGHSPLLENDGEPEPPIIR